MNLTCDLCGGTLLPKDDGAVCSVCGIEYGEKRIAEKQASAQPARNTNPQVQVVQENINQTQTQKQASEKYNKRMKKMRIVMLIIVAVVFWGSVTARSSNQVDDMISLGTIALAITLFAFKPWKDNGGKKK